MGDVGAIGECEASGGDDLGFVRLISHGRGNEKDTYVCFGCIYDWEVLTILETELTGELPPLTRKLSLIALSVLIILAKPALVQTPPSSSKTRVASSRIAST